MTRLLALSLALALVVTTTPIAAATSDQSSRATKTPPSVDLLRAYVAKLPVGSIVRVTPKQGRAFKAVLMVVDQNTDTIVVKPKTRIARPERQLALAEIDFVELQERNGGSTMKAVGIGMASAVGTFLGLILIAIAIGDD